MPRLWVGSSGLLLPGGSRHVLFPRMSAADLASYSMGSCLEGEVIGVLSSSLNSTPVPRSRSSGAIPLFSLYVFMSCTGQLYPCTALPNINISMTVKTIFKYSCMAFGSDLNPHSTSLMMTVNYNFSFQFSPFDTVSTTMFCYNDK